MTTKIHDGNASSPYRSGSPGLSTGLSMPFKSRSPQAIVHLSTVAALGQGTSAPRHRFDLVTGRCVHEKGAASKCTDPKKLDRINAASP